MAAPGKRIVWIYVVAIVVGVMLVLDIKSLSERALTRIPSKASIEKYLSEHFKYTKTSTGDTAIDYKKHIFDEDYVRTYGAYEETVEDSKTWKFSFKQRPSAKILYFRTYVEVMSRHFYDWLESAIDHPNLDVSIFGPGYQGWNESLSLDENLNSTYGCDYFDLVVVHDMDEWQLPKLCGKTLYLYEFGDVKGPTYVKKMLEIADKINIFSAKYGYILLEMMDVRYPLMKKYATKENAKLWAVNPECANDHVFKPGPWDEKNVDILLIGSISAYQYPLRHHVKTGIDKGIIKNAVIRKHPGYSMRSMGDSAPPPPTRYNRTYYSESESVKQQNEYGIQLRKTKICVFDALRLKIGIRKFAEAMASGCVIAADLPNEMEEIYRDIVIKISTNQTHTEINSILQNALQDTVELKRKALQGVLLARKYSICGRKVEQMLFAMDEYNRGFRGYYFPYGWRMDCHGYSDVGAENPNPWCYDDGMQPTIKQMLQASSKEPKR